MHQTLGTRLRSCGASAGRARHPPLPLFTPACIPIISRMPEADPATHAPAAQKRTKPFWSLNKIYWLLYVIPLAAWFAMDGTEMFFVGKDARDPGRAWFKLGFYLLLVNIISLFVWAEDKRRARRGDWRISEKTLVYLCTLGGLPGALLAMRMFHHKSQKWSLILRLFFWSAALAAFTFLVLPHSKDGSYANDARWGLCLFSLFWWNLSVAEGIVRVHSDNRRVLWRYLGILFAVLAVLVGASAGGMYLWRSMKGGDWTGWDAARAGIIAGGLGLSVLNEIWITKRGLRGKLPGWDPIAPAGVA